MKNRGVLNSQKNDVKYEHEFEYDLEYSDHAKANIYTFDIWERGKELDSKFSFMLRVMENGEDLKVIDLYPDMKNYYRGKGISVAMILKSKDLFQKRIISSSNKFPSFSGESNWEDAIEKVWKRMVDLGKVSYDLQNDYYYTI